MSDIGEMVERVARAIAAEHLGPDGMVWEQCHPKYQEDRRQMARAAIGAMRKPTASMLYRVEPLRAHDSIWRSMIDEALKK